jgi:hypothetical protein
MSRSWWKPRKSKHDPIHFAWGPRMDFHKLGTLCSRIEGNEEVNSKDNLFRNLWFYCTQYNLPLYRIVPVTFSFRLNESVFSSDLQNFAKIFLSQELKTSVPSLVPVETFSDRFNRTHQVYFDFEILTYTRPPPLLYSASRFLNPRAELINTSRYPTLFAGENIWMIKPSGMSRGRGLELFSKLEELKKFMHMYTREGYSTQDYSNIGYSDDNAHSPWVDFTGSGGNVKTGDVAQRASSQEGNQRKKNTRNNNSSTFMSFVIQKYIEKPILYKGYKFDTRVYAVFTQNRELYVFDEAYVRLASQPFSVKNMNYYIHLTNNAVQCNSKNYSAIIDGNIFALSQLEKELATELAVNENTKELSQLLTGNYLMDRIRDTTRTVFEAVHRKLDPRKRGDMFELFGLDFMVDVELGVWLLEVNSNPSLSESNDWLRKLLTRMLGDLFNITVDRYFPPPPGHRSPDPYPLSPYPDENLWYTHINLGV